MALEDVFGEGAAYRAPDGGLPPPAPGLIQVVTELRSVPGWPDVALPVGLVMVDLLLSLGWPRWAILEATGLDPAEIEQERVALGPTLLEEVGYGAGA